MRRHPLGDLVRRSETGCASNRLRGPRRLLPGMSVHATLLERYQTLPPWTQTTLKVLLVVLVGYVVLALVRRYVVGLMARSRHIDATLLGFLRALITSGGWMVLLVVVLGVAGFDVTALIGGLAIGGFILGFALKDTLGNLAAGMMLLFYRPFNVDDEVELNGHFGVVTGLGMALTRIRAADGRIITMPNGSVLGGAIVNHTRHPVRRADVIVGIAYEDDIGTAVKAILDALRADPRVLAEPEPSVWVSALADSSVNLQVRPWVRTPDYWHARADFHGLVKRAVEAAGCTIPFPQRDIHVLQEAA